MFDLFRSRDKMVRYMLGGLLGIVALSMVTYLIPSYNNGFTTDSSVLADVNGKKITAQYAQAQFQRVTQGAAVPPDMMDVYLPQFIEQMILQRAAVYQAERMGLTVNDDEILTGMIMNNPQFFPGGVLTSKENLEQFFAAQGLTLNDALEDMRSQLTLRKLQNALLETTVVNPKEAEDDYKRKYDKVKVQYISFDPAKFHAEAKVSDQDAHAYFDAHRAEYTQPDKYSFQVLVVDKARVEKDLNVSEAQLRQAYSGSMDNFRSPERVHTRHILFKTEGRSDAEKKALMTKAQDLIKKLRAGADFADEARKNSDDSGSAQRGGDLDWAVRGQMVPEFEKVAFALKNKEISDVVTTQFGYHILQALEHEQARVKPFDEVKADLATQLKSGLVNDKMQQLADQVQTTLAKTPKDAAGVARQFNVELVKVEKALASAAVPSVGNSPEIANVLPSLQPGQVSPILLLPSERMIVVVLDSKEAAHNSEWDEVSAQVKERVIGESAFRLADTRSKEAAERIKKGEDFAAVARSMKLEIMSPKEFGVADSIDGLGQGVYLSEAFVKPVGTVIGPNMIAGRAVIAKVTEKVPANMAAFEAERDAIVRELKRKKAQERNDLMLDSILERLVADGKVKVYRDQIQKLVASYRKQNPI